MALIQKRFEVQHQILVGPGGGRRVLDAQVDVLQRLPCGCDGLFCSSMVEISEKSSSSASAEASAGVVPASGSIKLEVQAIVTGGGVGCLGRLEVLRKHVEIERVGRLRGFNRRVGFRFQVQCRGRSPPAAAGAVAASAGP